MQNDKKIPNFSRNRKRRPPWNSRQVGVFGEINLVRVDSVGGLEIPRTLSRPLEVASRGVTVVVTSMSHCNESY